MAQRRILKDLKEVTESANENVTAEPVNPDNIFHWRGVIKGPVGSPYEGGEFRFNIEFPTDYPFKPPVFHFLTQVYHPNINKEGKICLEILSKDWNPAVTTAQVYVLLKEPNAESAVQPTVGAEYRDNYELFAKNAREYTKQYAQPKPE